MAVVLHCVAFQWFYGSLLDFECILNLSPSSVFQPSIRNNYVYDIHYYTIYIYHIHSSIQLVNISLCISLSVYVGGGGVCMNIQ